MEQDAFKRAATRALALPCWFEPTNVRILGGGITNVNLRLTDRGGDYVVRLGNDIPEHGVNRLNELALSRAAFEAGLSPKVHYWEKGVIVIEFIKAETLTSTEIHDADTLCDIAGLIRRAHTEMPRHFREEPVAFNVFNVLRSYADLLVSKDSRHAEKLPHLMSQMVAIEKVCGKFEPVLSHNDLLPANILRNEKQLWLIDWEYGGCNSPLFDLAGIATNSGLDADGEHLLLETYFECEPDTSLKYRFSAMKCASLLRETFWSMVSEITSEIDFDYPSYSAENLQRYSMAFEEFVSIEEDP